MCMSMINVKAEKKSILTYSSFLVSIGYEKDDVDGFDEAANSVYCDEKEAWAIFLHSIVNPKQCAK